jgi:RNA polymerase sigma-70 factor, ECF subfamily
MCMLLVLSMNGEDIVGLYDRHARELLGFFARRTREPQLALDLLGETFLTAFEKRDSCRGRGDGERAAWLFRIAANKLADHFRAGLSERHATERLAAELRTANPDERARIHELAELPETDRLRRAYESLSAQQRHAIQLRVINEQPYPMVAASLGVSEPAARARVSRGLNALRRAWPASQKGSGNDPS